MKPCWLALSLLLFAAPAAAQPCCGAITKQGAQLSGFLDASHVDQLWLPHQHVLWRSGKPNPLFPGYSKGTHCSAYAAAMAMRLHVPLLHPPEHGQRDLANAQYEWLQTQGPAQGWQSVDFIKAQSLANQGWLVLAVFENPDTARPGHIAVIRPSDKSQAALAQEGPQEAQAGEQNDTDTDIAQGFAHHRGAWVPGGGGGVRFFAHPIGWARIAAAAPP